MAITVTYDSNNAVSAAEVRTLSKKNAGQLEFVDKAGAAFETNDAGKVASGHDALVVAYEAVGLGSYYHMCREPGFTCEGTGIGPQG